MLYEVEGDLMLSRAQVLVQSVSVADPMIRGLARKLHNKFPALVDDFADWCEQEKPEPGMLWLWGEPGQLQIVNLITHAADTDPRRQRRPDKIALNRKQRLRAILSGRRWMNALNPWPCPQSVQANTASTGRRCAA